MEKETIKNILIIIGLIIAFIGLIVHVVSLYKKDDITKDLSVIMEIAGLICILVGEII